jgi:hypothetical protein
MILHRWDSIVEVQSQEKLLHTSLKNVLLIFLGAKLVRIGSLNTHLLDVQVIIKTLSLPSTTAQTMSPPTKALTNLKAGLATTNLQR